MTDLHTYIEIKASNLRMSEFIEEVKRIQAQHPDEEIFIDGDLYALVGRQKA